MRFLKLMTKHSGEIVCINAESIIGLLPQDDGTTKLILPDDTRLHVAQSIETIATKAGYVYR